MRVYKKSHLFVQLNQLDERTFDKNQKYGYSLGRMIIGKINKDRMCIDSYMGDVFDNDREITIESIFEEGDYAIYCEMSWIQNLTKNYVVSCYGESLVSFTMNDEVDNDIILDQMIQSHVQSLAKDKIHWYNEYILRASNPLGGYIYFYYRNDSRDKTLKEEVKMKNREYLEICGDYGNSDRFEVEVRGESKEIVKYKITNEGSGAYKYSRSL